MNTSSVILSEAKNLPRPPQRERARVRESNHPGRTHRSAPTVVRVLLAVALFTLALSYFAGPGMNMVKAEGPAATDTTLADQIGVRLVCQCGCASILINCVHQECMSRDQMMIAIKTQLGQGKSPDQIVQAFVQTYGEQVLAEPPKKGFNLTAWIAPFVGLVVGAFLIVLLLRGWVVRGRVAEVSAPAAGPATIDEEYLKRVEKEIEETP